MVVFKPAGFTKAAEDQKWRVAMQEELNMIEIKKHLRAS